MTVQCSEQNFNISFKIYSAGEYTVLYKALSSYEWSSIYNGAFIDAAIDRFNVAATQDICRCSYSFWAYQDA
jgi:hypothetical protein